MRRAALGRAVAALAAAAAAAGAAWAADPAAPPPPPTEETPDMTQELTLADVIPKQLESFHVVFLRRPAAAPEVPGEEAERLQIAHLAHLNRLREDGLTMAHGPFQAGPDAPLRGLVIFRGDLSREEVEAAMAADPWVGRGQLEAEIVGWISPAGSFSRPGGPFVMPAPGG